MRNEVLQSQETGGSGIANAGILLVKPHQSCTCVEVKGIAASGSLTHGCPSVRLRN